MDNKPSENGLPRILTERDMQILKLVEAGYSIAEVAEKVNLSQRTVERTVSRHQK